MSFNHGQLTPCRLKIMHFILSLGLALLMLISSSSACTVINLTKTGSTIAGNNEDWNDPDTRIWFIPASDGKYGREYFGFGNGYPQGGVNDQGLFFDFTATVERPITRSLDKPEYDGNLIEKVIEECASVEQALKLLDKYNLSRYAKAQIMLIDSSGNSAIVEGDDIIPLSGDYQILTNFYQTQFKRDEYPCARYRIADDFLSHVNNASVGIMTSTMAAVHQEGAYPTQYTNIHDLKSGDIHLYHFHNFNNPVKLNIYEELLKGEHSYDIPSLFPPNYSFDMFKKQQKKSIGTILHEEYKKAGIEEALQLYHELLKDKAKADEIDFNEKQLNMLGYWFLKEKNVEAAIAIFELNSQTFPKAFNTWDSLAEAYMIAGNKKLAIKNYKKSLKLNPENQNAKSKLKDLEGM